MALQRVPKVGLFFVQKKTGRVYVYNEAYAHRDDLLLYKDGELVATPDQPLKAHNQMLESPEALVQLLVQLVPDQARIVDLLREAYAAQAELEAAAAEGEEIPKIANDQGISSLPSFVLGEAK